MKLKELVHLIKRDLRNHGADYFLKALMVFLFNQSFRLVLNYRLGHYLHRNRGIIANFIILYLKKKQITKRNCDIGYSASIGTNIKFPHPLGIVIGESAYIGDNCMIWQGVTLGSSGKAGKDKEYPIVGNEVKIFPNSTLIGKIKIGNRTTIGANSLVNIDVPSYSLAAGIPARVVKTFIPNERRLPNFIIGGVMKSATTYLDEFLRSHPDVFMLPRVMPFSFFDNDEIYKKGIDWYSSLFKEVRSERLIGQTSADCNWNPESAKRIFTAIPDCKMIFVLRNPVDRTYSQYWHQVRMGREWMTFENVIKNESKRIKKDYYHYRMFSYLDRGKYKSQISVYHSYFGVDNVLVIPYEFLIKNNLFVVNKVYEFLGLSSVEDLNQIVSLEKKKTNSAFIPKSWLLLYLTYSLIKLGLGRLGIVLHNLNMKKGRPPIMNEKTRNQLNDFFAEDIDYHKYLMAEWESMLASKPNA